jgi:hypothetical protein
MKNWDLDILLYMSTDLQHYISLEAVLNTILLYTRIIHQVNQYRSIPILVHPEN